MALLTPLSHDAARELLIGHGVELRTLTPLVAGSVNSNFLLEAEDGQGYFARIYEEQGPAGADFELRLNQALHRAGVPVALPVPRLDGALYSMAGDKPFAVYQRAEGEVLCQKRVTGEVTRALGEALARVHQAELGGLEVPAGRFDPSRLLFRLELVEASGRRELVEAAGRVRELLARLERVRDPGLARGLTHGDLFRDNVLVRGGRIGALLDFESACSGTFAYDLAVTLLAWCYGDELEPGLVQPLLEGYHAVRPLDARERAALPVEAAAACARFATTRMTDFSLRVPEGARPGRDYRRFFQRLDALEAGALAAPLAALV
jgi:homoserine kinase type II